MSSTGNTAPREWDATTYDRIADPMTRWGEAVLERLPLRGEENVLDAGCGSGRVTQQLLERLPEGRVTALDHSRDMLRQARERIGEDGRVTYLAADLADLAKPLPVAPASFDAVFSTATFHWVHDHDALFRNLARVMRPGARLVAQCGGVGNIATVAAALEELGTPYESVMFATPEETAARLEASGFADIEVWLHDEPTEIPPEDLETYLATVILRAHIHEMPEDRRAWFVHEVATRLPGPRLDYVRLNICATRA
jgi:trans-aconitate 2-methyltransferase